MEIINKDIEDFKTEHINRDVYLPFDYFSEPSEITEEEMLAQDKYFKKKQEIVKYVLEGYELARNYDTVMELECLRTEFPMIQVTGGKDNIIFKFPRKWIRIIIRTPLEDYRRARQKLIESAIKENNQEELNNLLPTIQEIRERRIKKRKLLREYFSKRLK